MKKLALVLVLAVLLGVGAVGVMSSPSYAQFYEYAAPPPNPYANPWVGSNTPWTFYNGDWFLNGILYYFFGPQYGWAPYYAYPPTYIVRPSDWYAPRWMTWYRGHPHYWQNFTRAYPYWRGHREGQHYDRTFYEQHHRGQGSGWQQGFQGRPVGQPHPGVQRPGPAPVRPEGQRPGPAGSFHPEGQRPGPAPGFGPQGQRPAPAQVTPREGQRPAPARVAPPEAQRPAPAQMAPREGQRPAPAQMAPREAQRPAPARVAPPEGQRPAPARVAPPEGQRQAPARVAPAEGQKRGAPGPAEKPAGPGEEKH